MDIFTTQLTRVVPVPIKRANLKVKALLKEAANSKLTQDPNHLENHEYYFTPEDEYHSSKQDNQEQDNQELLNDKLIVGSTSSSQDEVTEKVNGSEKKADSKDGDTKHLDLYA